MRTALSAWLTGSTAPPDGQAGHSNRPNSAYNGDGSPAVSVSWEDWQRAYEQARGAEGRQQQEGHVRGAENRQRDECAKGLGVGNGRCEQSKGSDNGSGRGEGWQRVWDHAKSVEGRKQEGHGQGTAQGSGERDEWGWVGGFATRHGEGGGTEGQAQVVGKGRDVGGMQGQGQGVVVCEGGWEWLHRPSAPPVWEMTGAVAQPVSQPEARSVSTGYQEAQAGVEGGAEGWRRTGMGTGGAVGRVERMGGEGEGDSAVIGGSAGVGDAGGGRRGGGRGVVGAVRECVSLDWVPERLLVKFQQRVGMYRLGFNFQFRHSHHDLPVNPSVLATPVSLAVSASPIHTLTSATGLRESRPLITVGPYQAYPADIRIVVKPSAPSPPSKAASKRPAPSTASLATRLAGMVTRVAWAAVGGGKVQVMPVAGTVQVASGRVGLLGLADARVTGWKRAGSWFQGSAVWQTAWHLPIPAQLPGLQAWCIALGGGGRGRGAGDACGGYCAGGIWTGVPAGTGLLGLACWDWLMLGWSSTRLTRPHSHSSSARGRETQPGASRGAGLAGGSDMSGCHVDTSSGMNVHGSGNGTGGMRVSTDGEAREGGLWSAGRGEVEQQGGGAAGSGGGVVQVARAKAGMVHRVSGMVHRVSGMVHRVSGMVHRVSGMVHRVSGMVHRVSGMVHRVSGMVHRVSGMVHWVSGTVP
ncbi:unnamed protein product [Closterium sp. Naga37s-1]|nr:unnamed protein product [Closterium sp. Naga37s-1]